MEYYYFEPVGILLSFQHRTKEEVQEIFTQTLQSETKNMITCLGEFGIERVFTLVEPRFKFKFTVQNEQILEIH